MYHPHLVTQSAPRPGGPQSFMWPCLHMRECVRAVRELVLRRRMPPRPINPAAVRLTHLHPPTRRQPCTHHSSFPPPVTPATVKMMPRSFSPSRAATAAPAAARFGLPIRSRCSPLRAAMRRPDGGWRKECGLARSIVPEAKDLLCSMNRPLLLYRDSTDV